MFILDYKNTKIYSYNQLKINQINRMSDFELFFFVVKFLILFYF